MTPTGNGGTATEVGSNAADDFVTIFETSSNWGRWGDEDQLGTLNFLADGRGVEAFAAEVCSNQQVGLSRRISPTWSQANQTPVQHHMISSGAEAKDGAHGMSDWFGVTSHGFGITHVDALNHMAWCGQLYNGVPASTVTTTRGGSFGSIEAMRDGVIGRGVLLDVPAYRGSDFLERSTAIGIKDLIGCEERQGVQVRAGDVVIVRTGRDARERVHGEVDYWVDGIEGLHFSCARWLHERGVSMLVTDAGGDVVPSGVEGVGFPLHVLCLVSMGLWMVDNAQLEELRRVCSTSDRWAFGFTMSVPRFKNATGAPVNPIAVF
ncbi:cyclase family protein [Janibacter hoylei]|uniref:cyclase family protein n=1 Tax=Janibacter hoylei TaxID=364298 RepID=UPI002491A55D|nr:cyclase family protein [Janibacter hoylei]